MAMAAYASAQSTLLGFFAARGSGSTTSAKFADVKFVALELGFESGAVGAPCALERIGCEAIALGSVVAGPSFVFNSGNDSSRTALMSRCRQPFGFLIQVKIFFSLLPQQALNPTASESP